MDNNLRLAKEIMSHVGGVGNIASLNHCSTRLRLRVNKEENFDVEAIKKIDGVLDVVKAIGGFQIIVGNNVSKVYAAIVANYDPRPAQRHLHQSERCRRRCRKGFTPTLAEPQQRHQPGG